MTKKTTTSKTGLLLSAGALLLAATIAPATAGYAQSDNTQLMQRLKQMETQLNTLNRAVYRDDKSGLSAPSDNTAAISNFEVRLSQIENQMRDLTGRLETMGHDIQQTKDRLDKMAADNELRFQQQGQASSGAVTGSSSTGSSSATPPQPEVAQPADLNNSQPPKVLGTLSTSGAGGDPASVLYETGFADIRAAKYDEAEKKFKEFVAKYPTHNLAANAQYWLAETYYVRGDYAQSSKAFAQGYQDFPQGQKAADSLLKLGLSLTKIGKKEDACLSFMQLKKQFPNDQSTVGARAQQEIKALGCK